MTRSALQRYLRQEPFRPLIVLTTAGRRYEINNPDMAWLRPTRLFVALPPAEENPYREEPDTVVDLALDHIAGVEELQQTGR